MMILSPLPKLEVLRNRRLGIEGASHYCLNLVQLNGPLVRFDHSSTRDVILLIVVAQVDVTHRILIIIKNDARFQNV